MGLNREYLVKGAEEKIVSAYYRYMVDIAVLFGADRQRAVKELKESLDFEIGLAKISLPLEERRDAAKLYNPMKIADLQYRFPSIPWQEYLNTILSPLSIRHDDIIIVNSPKYLSELEALLSNTPKRYARRPHVSKLADWGGFPLLRIVIAFAQDPSELRDLESGRVVR